MGQGGCCGLGQEVKVRTVIPCQTKPGGLRRHKEVYTTHPMVPSACHTAQGDMAVPPRLLHLTQVLTQPWAASDWGLTLLPLSSCSGQRQHSSATSMTTLAQGCPPEPHPHWGKLGLLRMLL